MKKWNKQQVFFFVVFLLGLALILFPLVSQLAYYQASRVTIEEFDDSVSQMDLTEVNRRIDLAHAYNASLKGQNGQSIQVHDPFTAQEKQEGRAEYARMLEVNEQIGYVDIPKIGEKLPVYAGTQEEVLQKGAGHIEGTSLPVGGSATHTVITAHRGLPTARLFTDLDQLEEGDVFYITNLKETLAYQVDDQVVIEPHEVEYLDLRGEEDIATLLTCTPYMINSHRLLVTGHRIPYDPADQVQAQEPNRLWLYLALVLLVLVVIAVWVYRRRRKRKLTHD